MVRLRISSLAAALLYAATAQAGIVPPDPRESVAAPVLPDGKGKALFRAIARKEAEQAGLPYDLVDAVMRIESNYVPSVIGGVGEIGLMQILPTTAEMMGFRGDLGDLSEPTVNIHYGATYLGQAWRLTKGNVCRTLMKYRAGHGAESMSQLSVTYCSRAKAHLAEIGSPLAELITPTDLVVTSVATTLAEPSVASLSLTKTVGGVTKPKTGEAFWVAFKARIAKINARIEAKWRRTAAR